MPVAHTYIAQCGSTPPSRGEEVLFTDGNWMEEIRVKALCDEEEQERAPDIESNREALQTAEKLLEYARSKGNEKLSLVLSKSTDLLQEMVLQNEKKAIIHDFFGK